MALTPSDMVDLGTKAPDFSLSEPASGDEVSLSRVRGDYGTVVMFICNHCPFVKHVDDELVRVASGYLDRGIGFVAISANDPASHPDDSPERMASKAADYPFPYLFDETQQVAKAYGATCTPDFFVYDEDDSLVYRGQLDDSRPGRDEPLDGHSLREALDRLMRGDAPISDQRPSIGCNIKWRT